MRANRAASNPTASGLTCTSSAIPPPQGAPNRVSA